MCLDKISTQLNHGTIIRTGITCDKIPYYMSDAACSWFSRVAENLET